MLTEETTETGRPREPLVRSEASGCLIVLTGTAVGKMFKLTKSKYVIGRGTDVDIKLEDDAASRRHAKLMQQGSAQLTLQDLGSSNGTFVNGVKISSRELIDGDHIQIGATSMLKFSIHSALEEQFHQQLYMGATRDYLTSTYNTRFFDEQLNKDITHARRHAVPLSLLVIELDPLKAVNESHGAAAGDALLATAAAMFAASVRNEDVLCRIRGDRFAVIARGSGRNGACVLAERLRGLIERQGVEHQGQRLAATVSIGVAAFNPARHGNRHQLLEEAEKKLHEAKTSGRNCVRFS